MIVGIHLALPPKHSQGIVINTAIFYYLLLSTISHYYLLLYTINTFMIILSSTFITIMLLLCRCYCSCRRSRYAGLGFVYVRLLSAIVHFAFLPVLLLNRFEIHHPTGACLCQIIMYQAILAKSVFQNPLLTRCMKVTQWWQHLEIKGTMAE